MRYPKLRELKEAVKALLKGPYTSRFPAVPHQPFERFRGKPEFDERSCIGCTACIQVCPAGALEFRDTKDASGKACRVLTVSWEKCIACGQCQANCPPQKGIVLSREFDLATTGKREELAQSITKELLVCACCGETVAPRDQILWVARRLGPLIFSNASLMLYYLRNAGLAQQEGSVPRAGAEPGQLLRPDRIRVLCPRCRREAVLKS